MRILSWNVNGIRSLKEDLKTNFAELDADIICFQETKLSRDQLCESLALVDGYVSFYSFCQTKRAGYSGVATFCKISHQPSAAVDNLSTNELTCTTQNDIQNLDCEGRAVITQHQLKTPLEGKTLLSVVNVYCPCVTGDIEGREPFRLQFLSLLEKRVKILYENSFVIVLGDLNISHQQVDHCEPESIEDFDNQPHRQWFSKMVSEDHGMLIDTFRHLHPSDKQAFTCWNTKSGARQTNFGTRIDYVLLDRRLVLSLQSADILADYEGSDHCPVAMTSSIELQASQTLPSLCSVNMKEFKAKQQKITMFMGNKNVKKDMFGAHSPQKRKSSSVNQPTLFKFMKKPNIPSCAEVHSERECTTVNNAQEISPVKTMNNDWKSIFGKKNIPFVPKCKGHSEACVRQIVKKDGINKGKAFYACARPVGHKDNKDARCNHFEWEKKS